MALKTVQTFEQEGRFLCTLKCGQCRYIRPENNIRCKNRVCIGRPLCWIHNRKTYGVQVKQSTITDAGKGLFATKDFEKDDLICPYVGELTTQACLNERYGEDGTGPYALTFDGGRATDSACYRGVASMSNGLINQRTGRSRPRQLHNAIITEAEMDGVTYPALYATKSIAVGDEIFCWYGDEYILTDDHTTKRRKRNDTRPC